MLKMNMSEKTNRELLEITTVYANEYQIWAVDAAKLELSRRNIDVLELEKIESLISYDYALEKSLKAREASSYSRFLNFLVDTAVIFTIIALGHLFINRGEQLIVKLVLMVYLFYYILLEYKFKKTVGKWVTGTEVVKEDGTEADLPEIIKRTFCRLVPLDPLSFLFNFSGMKFHDTFTQTRVVKSEKE